MIRQVTISGTVIDLESPRPEMFHISDIARGLANTCRFSGQVHQFYSVAQHSVLVSLLVDPAYTKAAMLHDASEAYMGDLSRHLKHHPFLAGYRTIEKVVSNSILDRFDVVIAAGKDAHIKHADDLAAIYEQVVLRWRQIWKAEEHINHFTGMGFVKTEARPLLALARRLPACDMYRALPPQDAEAQFLARWLGVCRP